MDDLEERSKKMEKERGKKISNEDHEQNRGRERR